VVSDERRRGRAAREAAAGVTPGPEVEALVRQEEDLVVERLERLGARCERVTVLFAVGLDHVGDVRDSRQERRPTPEHDPLTVHENTHPGARVRTLVRDVVHEPRVAAERRPAAGRLQVRLRRNRVLAVRELVGDVREQLDERDPDVRRAALGPPGREQADPVEHQRPERLEVLRQVVDRRRLAELGRAVADRRTVEVGRALDLERELDRREQRIEARRRLVARRPGDQPQRVGREVAAGVGPDEQQRRRVVEPGRQHRNLGRRRRGRLDRRNPVAAGDPDVRLRRQRSGGLQHPHEERPLLEAGRRLRVRDLDVLDPVEVPRFLDGLQAPLVAAGVPHGTALEKDTERRSCVRSAT
jgi:hypothetical protein